MPTAINKPAVKNLAHSSTNHTPGISFTLHYAIVEEVVTEPVLNAVTTTGSLTDNISATGTFTFETGKGFGSIRCSKMPEATEKTMANGSSENTIDLHFLDSDEAKGFRHTFRTSQLILVYKDANGKWRKYGTLAFPVTISESEAKNADGSLVVKLTASVQPIAILPSDFVPVAPAA
jgi:hypothetical protein